MADIKKAATRQSYGEALVELGAVNQKIYVIDADLSKATMTAGFKKAFPDRFINAGIAEGNMVTMAAGMATAGIIPFASSFAMFAAGRAYEQIRNAIGYPKLNVKICATHAGLSVGEDGATHQCCEDIALMRTIPGMTILNPADDAETKACIKAAAEMYGPVYVRLGRLPVPAINGEDYKFELGKGVTLREGKDVTIVATGLMVHEALKACEILAQEAINARLINIHTIKPIDRGIIMKAARETGAIVTAEEHTIMGGLGSAVCDVVCETCPVPVLKVGVEDVYGSSGPAAEVLKAYGLDAAHIAEKAKQAVGFKR